MEKLEPIAAFTGPNCHLSFSHQSSPSLIPFRRCSAAAPITCQSVAFFLLAALFPKLHLL